MKSTTTTGAGRGIVPTMQSQINALETQFNNFQRTILGTGGGSTGGGGGNGGTGNARRGTAGGVKRRRSAKAAGGGTGGTNREWITAQLRAHPKGLTAAQLKQMAVDAGRNTYVNYPNDVLSKMRSAITHRGNLFTLKTTGGTGPVPKAGGARVRARRKPMARAARAAA